MKKKYKKPEIFMESFEVSEFIAANCGRNSQNISMSEFEQFREDGKINFGGVNLFESTSCDVDAASFDFAQNDKPCYDIPVRSLSTHS